MFIKQHIEDVFCLKLNSVSFQTLQEQTAPSPLFSQIWLHPPFEARSQGCTEIEKSYQEGETPCNKSDTDVLTACAKKTLNYLKSIH